MVSGKPGKPERTGQALKAGKAGKAGKPEKAGKARKAAADATTGRPAARSGPAEPVLAAGAVLWRHSPDDGSMEIALIHRPRYDDWSHPKGKVKSGEAPKRAARREVKEETGMDCVLGAALPSCRYLAGGRPKLVRYWAAEATGGSFRPGREVDRLVWFSPVLARLRLTHDRDRPLVDALLRVAGKPA